MQLVWVVNKQFNAVLQEFVDSVNSILKSVK